MPRVRVRKPGVHVPKNALELNNEKDSFKHGLYVHVYLLHIRGLSRPAKTVHEGAQSMLYEGFSPCLLRGGLTSYDASTLITYELPGC